MKVRRTAPQRDSGQSAARRPAATHGAVVEAVVTALGAQGDGIALAGEQRLYIPFTVPGDRVQARLGEAQGDGHAAELVEVLSPGSGRAVPPCRHFGRCGGCNVQHLADDVYAAWKLGRLHHALAQAGLAGVEIAPLARTPPEARRRATFAAVRDGRAVRLGFNVRRGHDIVDLVHCPVLEPRIVGLLPALRRLLASLLNARQRITVQVSMLEGGLDVVLDGAIELGLSAREQLAAFATVADVARVSWRPGTDAPAEPVVQLRPVEAIFAGAFVAMPPGGFLQASGQGEAALVEAVVAAVAPQRTAVDLFAGAGTFTFPLARRGLRVHAVDADDACLKAVATAARALPGDSVGTERRNLFARPLLAEELRGFEAVVFDPPRAGARVQAEQLARSTVPVVVAVSCNPGSFARDARILVEGGYRLEWIIPVDQFLWSPHLELAAVFRR